MLAAQNVLKDLRVTSLPGEKALITLTMAKKATNPIGFTIENPARISLDFMHTKNRLRKRRYKVSLGMARSLNVVSARGRTRLVVNLSKLVPYTTRVSGNKVYVTIDSGSVRRMARRHNSNRVRPAASGQRINIIDFRRGENGQGRIIVTLANPNAAVDIKQRDGKIIADFVNTRLPSNLERRLDVLDFATPVKNIDTFTKGNNVRMVITPIGKFHHMAYQANNVYTIEVKPVKKKIIKRATGINGDYRGEKLTLNFQNIKVRAVLQLLADFTGLNIVVSDSVKGSLTLRLKNVPWDQALDIILKSKGLAMRRTGNVMRIAPTEEMSQIEQAELTARKKVTELEPLRTEWFQINFASAKEILATINNKKASLLSKRGRAVTDKRTNTLMVLDTPDRLSEIRKLIKRLDVPVRQVLIESRIVIATNDFSRDLGVKFGVSSTNKFNNGKNFITAGGPQNTDGTLSNNVMLDMGVDSSKNKAGRFGLAIGKLGSSILQLELSALEAEGRGEIVSNPRLVTANKKEAYIEQGLEIPYSQNASSGAATVSFKKAVLSLKVTPQITPDDRVILDLVVKKDAANFSATFRDGVPGIDTREISTQVLVNNGETVVLGGIYEGERKKNIARVPVLGRIPLLGFLFRDKQIVDKKSELLIFVTPKIIKDGLKNVAQ